MHVNAWLFNHAVCKIGLTSFHSLEGFDPQFQNPPPASLQYSQKHWAAGEEIRPQAGHPPPPKPSEEV
jgi:hypothetical protein